MKKCIFCNKKKHKIVYNNRYFYVLRDNFPVTQNHTLIITKKHKKSFRIKTEFSLISRNFFYEGLSTNCVTIFGMRQLGRFYVNHSIAVFFDNSTNAM